MPGPQALAMPTALAGEAQFAAATKGSGAKAAPTASLAKALAPAFTTEVTWVS